MFEPFISLKNIYYHISVYEYKNFNSDFVKNLQSSFAMAPVNKAADNLTIMCKKFYGQKLESPSIKRNFATRILVSLIAGF